MTSKPGDTNFLHDIPVGIDRFGRASFARALSTALSLPPRAPGLVVGIEAPWGSGKTFVINQVKAMLLELQPPPAVVEFNPWIVAGADVAVEALLSQIAAAVAGISNEGKSLAAAKAGKSVLQYLALLRHLKYLKYVPGATALGNIAEDVGEFAETAGSGAVEAGDDLDKVIATLAKRDLLKQKVEVATSLAALDVPIVVIVDDIDRLPSEEIRSVMRGVKAVADFPRVSYLLAYDSDVVSRSLDRRMALGRAYLEKIVQVQYELPPPLPWRMKAFVEGVIDDALTAASLPSLTSNQDSWHLVTSHLARLCRHPRDIVRIANRLRISLPATKGEVDSGDVALLEALHVTQPAVASAIRTHPEDFAGELGLNFEDLGFRAYFMQAQKELGKGAAEKRWQKHLPGSLPLTVSLTLHHLFPSRGDAEAPMRVCNPDRLYRFLSCGPEGSLIERTDVESNLNDIGQLRQALADPDVAVELVRGLVAFSRSLVIHNPSAAIRAMCDAANDHLGESPTARTLVTRIADGIEELLRFSAEKEELVEIIIQGAPLTVSARIVYRAGVEVGEIQGSHRGADVKLLPLEIFRRSRSKWLALMPRDVSLEAAPLSVLATWGELIKDFRPARQQATLFAEKHLSRFLNDLSLTSEFPISLDQLRLIDDPIALAKRVRLAITQTGDEDGGMARALEILESAQVVEYFKARKERGAPI
jgi:hypothetical protein